MSEPIHIISLGAGVQSSAMALMAHVGEITPKPSFAVFSDTKWEKLATYLWLKALCGCTVREFEPGRFEAVEGRWQDGMLSFPVVIVSNGDLRKEQIDARLRGRAVDGNRSASLPYFTMQPGAKSEGKIKRQCTSDYKIEPIERWMKRELLALPKRSRLPKSPAIIQWRGISTDEISRAKDSRVSWYATRHPLALEKRMSRHDCETWLWKHYEVKVPDSSCVGCPLHDNNRWRRIKQNPEQWADATQFDSAIRKAGGMRGDTFLHRSCKPLSAVDLSVEEDRGQINMFNNECEGMCGV